MSYAHECDIWSCGVILYLIMSGKQPFKGSTNEETFTNIVNGEFTFEDEAWSDISNDAKDCVLKMLTWDESLRPSAAQMLEHPWIVSNGTSRSIRSADALKNSEELDARSLLKVIVCTFTASQLLSKAEREQIERSFRSRDTNNDGKLSRSESKIAYQAALGADLDDDEVNSIFKNFDSDEAGELKYTEFVLGALYLKALLSKENLSTVFRSFDKDNKGYITMLELKDMLKHDMVLEVDMLKGIISDEGKLGDDQKVSYYEFLSLAANPPQKATSSSNREAHPVSETDSDDNRPSPSPDSDEAELTESDCQVADEPSGDKSLSLRLSATQFVAHRLGQLTDHYDIVDFIAKGKYSFCLC